MPTYSVWAQGKPASFVDAPHSFAARVQYAGMHDVPITDCMSRRVDLIDDQWRKATKQP